MKVEVVPVTSLTEDPANVRSHPDKNLEAIKGSLKRFGQQKPIVVNLQGVVIAGNGTLRAARELGWENIAIVRTKLEGVDATAFAIADNRTSELAEWDFEGLSGLLKEIAKTEGMDLASLGWSDYDLEPLLKADWNPPEVEADDDPEALGGGGDSERPRGRWIEVTAEERAVFERAVEQLIFERKDQELPEGRAVALLAERYLGRFDPPPASTPKKEESPGGSGALAAETTGEATCSQP
jgi:ParB-like chromosome segregation protein Spo0J